MECGYSAKVNGTMNTKTNFKCGSNFYDGENMGRNSPGALLDMLAEVASQTLHSEKKQNEITMVPKNKAKTDPLKRKSQELSYSLLQLLSMPATQLVKQFTIFTSDELKRQYSYTCALVPDCGQRYTSFASEGRARMSIKSHLVDHLEYLKNNQDIYSSFTATTVKYRKSKANLQNKKIKVQQVKKPQGNLNKENKDVKTEKCTSYLRKILSNEMNLKEFENHKIQESKTKEEINSNEEKLQISSNTKFLVDHSYYEHIKNDALEKSSLENPSDVISNNIMEEKIVLMVVENDEVHVKELPYITHKLSQDKKAETEKEESNLNNHQNPLTWSVENCSNRNMENANTAKPKGKAKFIGTSKEEREMALALMERIKKKGNPTGGNLQCRICDPPRSFTAPTTLVSHYRSHAGIKPYECRICRAVFTRRHSLKYHMLIHQNQTRFTCADCEKKFRHPSHFREHRRRHTGEAPFGCDDCGQRFKTRNTYKRHLKTRHGKVLTTSGELLCLSEEDFQKVRTNRRKKTDYVVPSETAMATNVIIQYQKCEALNCSGHLPGDEECCQVQDINDNGTVWMNYCDYDASGESPTEKTDFIETKLEIEANENDAKQSDFVGESNKEQETVELEHVSDNLQMIHNDILYHDTEALYGVENLNEYMNVDYGDAQFANDDDAFVYQRNEENMDNEMGYPSGNSSEEFNDRYSECIKNLQAQSNSTNSKNGILYKDDNTEGISCDTKVITEQVIQYEEHGSTLQIEKQESVELETDFKTQRNKDDNDEVPENGTVKNNSTWDSTLLEYLVTNNSSGTVAHSETENNLKETHSVNAEQCDESTTMPLENAVEKKSENSSKIVSQVKLLCNQNDSAVQLLKNGKITLFGKKPQTINFVQNGKQGAILLLANSGDAKVAEFLKVDQSNVVIKGLKTLPIVTVSDK